MNDDDITTEFNEFKEGPYHNGCTEWLMQNDGTYTKFMSIYYRNGRVDTHTVESGVTEKELFQRRLNGSA